jgi:hypothetical protein
MRDSNTILWALLAILGGLSALLWLRRIHFKLTTRPAHGRAQDGWRRGLPALTAFAFSMLLCGTGVGGILGVTYAPEVVFGDIEDPPTLPMYTMSSDYGSAVADPATEQEDSANATEETERRPSLGIVEVAEAASPTSTADGDTPVFGVRVGVFGNPENANGSVRALRAAGYSPLAVRRTGSSGSPLYFVYAGTFPVRGEAESVARDLRNEGADPMVVEIVLRRTGT